MAESVIISHDQYLEEAAKLTRESLEILRDTKNLGAEAFEKAENLSIAAAKMREQSENLKALESSRAKAMGEVKDNDPEDPAPDVAKKLEGTGGYASMGHWFKSVHNFKKNGFLHPQGLVYWDGEGDDKARLHPVKNAKALAESVGSTGGFLVPAEFQARLLSVQASASVVRPRAQVIRMNRRTVSIPALVQSSVVSGGFNWFGGIKTYYTEEGGQKGESQPSFRQITLTAHKLTGYTASSDELLEDSAISLQDFLMGDMGFPGAFAAQADWDYLQGDGVGKPEGILNSDATITIPRSEAGEIHYEDLTNMLAHAMPNSSLVWVMSQSAMAQMLNLQGPTGNPMYLWANAISGAPSSLLGFPVIFTDKLPPLGTRGDVLLAAFNYYLIGDRQAVTMDVSIHELFRHDQTAWRAFMRHDGKTWLDAPISYGRSTEQGTLSPFVVLGDEAT